MVNEMSITKVVSDSKIYKKESKLLMMKNILDQKSYLEALMKTDTTTRRKLLTQTTTKQQKALVELIINLVKGNVPLTTLQKSKLMKHKKAFRRICKLCYSQKKNKIINVKGQVLKNELVQTGGALPFLIAPLIALAAKAALGGVVSAGAGYATKKIIDAASK